MSRWAFTIPMLQQTRGYLLTFEPTLKIGEEHVSNEKRECINCGDVLLLR